MWITALANHVGASCINQYLKAAATLVALSTDSTAAAELVAAALAGGVERFRAAGFEPLPALNPYWDIQGATFEDPDGYRVVLQNAAWGG